MSPNLRITPAYGFAMPDDLFAFWDFVQMVTPQALEEAVDVIALEGPFAVLVGQLAVDPWWQARYYNDPPEFFTVMSGLTDGLHWGYYCDDLPRETCTVASYYSNDALVLSSAGDSLFMAFRHEVELHHRDCLTFLVDDPGEAASYAAQLERIAQVRATLQRYATADRAEEGEAYIDRYQHDSRRHPIAPTRDGMGIVAPPDAYRPLVTPDPFAAWDYHPTSIEVQTMAEAATAALRAGFPATALKLGKDLWGYAEHEDVSYRLLDQAYAALDRPLLRHYLERCQQHRAWLRSREASHAR